MDITYRPVTPAEIPAYCRACALGFGESADWYDKHPEWGGCEPERTVAAFDGDAIVGTGRNYSLELTLPGGAVVPLAGVSAVAVHPTHTRRGILRSMMTVMLDDAIAHDAPVAALTASEGTIYERFGFGISVQSLHVDIETTEVEFAGPAPDGRLRMLDLDSARKLEPEVFDRARRARPGGISRPDAWWAAEQTHPDFGTRFDVVYEAPDGSVDGYACYSIKEKWLPGRADNRMNVAEVISLTPDAQHALWRHVCDVDLVRRIEGWHNPSDLPLPWMLKNPRAVVGRIGDFIWTRILDVPAALGARTYPAEGRVTIEVADEFRPDGAARGVFTIEGGPDGAQVTEGGSPDLACDVAMLSALWLGGERWSTLAAAGRVEERTEGALATADAMFASAPLPYSYTWF